MIELDKKFNPDNSGTEFDESILKSLPLPIYDVYRLIEGQNDYEKSLQILCLSLIPWTYQYTALIMSGEYLECTHEPSFEVTDNLLNMVKKPGPGKWIGFTRVAAEYFSTRSTLVISQQTVSTLNEIMNSKSRPHVKLFETDNKLEYSDALINIRNRFAHSRAFTPEKARELFLDYFQIWKAWIVLIKDLFAPRLLFWSNTNNSVLSFDNRSLDVCKLSAKPDEKTTLLWNESNNTYLKLHPIIVTLADTSKTDGEVAFLEEIKNKYLFYLKGDNFFKLKDEFEILSGKLESKTIVEETVAAENLTLKTFADRIDRITNQTITGFQDSLKYIPEMYLDRPAVSSKLDSWVESNLSGCIVAGNPGTGKTSIITNWCLQRKAKGDHILLFEASSLKDSDITMIIEKELNLASPLKDCLDSIQKQNTNPSGDLKPKKFIIVVDAINEFIGINNENRSRLWREINSLISILNLYNPWIKCLVTTRSDLWSTDFPGKDGAFDLLKDKYYWGDKEEGFPRIALGDLAQTEAGEIFEKARATIPSMAVQSSFSELSDKTQKVLCNPFLLRLALVAYNGKKMPSLSKSKIERQFAKEKITEEKDKKTVLFALLERMSELKKTEVTFDEFLQVDTTVKPKKKLSKKEKLNLEKLIYDPRPQSPYKKLIKEGMIEERTDDSSAESLENIRFSQDKITDIIYTEFQRSFIKLVYKIILGMGLFFLFIPVVLTIQKNYQNDKWFNEKIKPELIESISDGATVDHIYSISYELIGRVDKVTVYGISILLLFLFCTVAILAILAPYLRFWAARIIKYDLPTRFIKEKFNEIRNKKMMIGFVPIFAAYYVWAIYQNKYSTQPLPLDTSNPFIYGIPIVFVALVIWIVILGGIIVYKNAHSPQDVYAVFGKKEAYQYFLENLVVIPFVLILFFGSQPLINLLDISTDDTLISLREQWLTDESIALLKENNLELFSKIDKTYTNLVEGWAAIIGNVLTLTFKVVAIGITMMVPVYLLMHFIVGYLLSNVLKKKFSYKQN